MCGPALAIASFAIGAAQSVMGYMGQAAQAEAQTKYYEQNRAAANRAAVNKYASQQNRILQEQAKATDEKIEVGLEGLRSRSQAVAAASEGGVSGLSVDALLSDFMGAEGRFDNKTDNNYMMSASYMRDEMKSTQSQAEARINSVRPGTKPSFLGAALRIAGMGVQTFAKIQAG